MITSDDFDNRHEELATGLYSGIDACAWSATLSHKHLADC